MSVCVAAESGLKSADADPTGVSSLVSVSDFLGRPDLLSRWSSLLQITAGAHPFLRPEAIQAQFAPGSAQAYVVFSGEGAFSAAALVDPWSLKIPQIGPAGIKVPCMRIYGKSILSDGSHDAAVELLNTLARRLPNNPVLYIEAADVRDSLRQACGMTLSYRLQMTGPDQPRWRIQLPQNDDVGAFWQAAFSAKTRNTLRRKRKKMQPYCVDITTTAKDVRLFLETARTISEQTWQSKQLGLRVRADQRECELYAALAEAGLFRGYILSVNDQPTAFVITTRSGMTIHFEETGYIPQSDRSSPGLILVSEMVDDLISSQVGTCLDFGLGHADYKELFSNDQSLSEDLYLFPRRTKAALLQTSMAAETRLLAASRQFLRKTGLYNYVRNRKRRSPQS